MKFLRQSTAVVIQAGPVLGVDFLTPNTGIALASTRSELFKAGASSAIDISTRSWAHISGGVYALTLTAGDTDTLGPLLMHIHLAATTPFTVHANVLSAQAYLGLCGGGNFSADIQAVFASANAASQLANGANATQTVTVGNGGTTTLVPTDLTSAVTNFYAGRSLVFLTGALIYQACSIIGYNGSTKRLTVSALTSAPAAGDTAIIV